ADPALRRAAVRRAGAVLRQVHKAGCYLERDIQDRVSRILTVRGKTPLELTVALSTVHGIEKCHYANPARARRDLAALAGCITGWCSRTDLLRGLLAYLGQPRWTPAAKHFARQVLRRLPPPRRLRRAAA